MTESYLSQMQNYFRSSKPWRGKRCLIQSTAFFAPRDRDLPAAGFRGHAVNFITPCGGPNFRQRSSVLGVTEHSWVSPICFAYGTPHSTSVSSRDSRRWRRKHPFILSQGLSVADNLRPHAIYFVFLFQVHKVAKKICSFICVRFFVLSVKTLFWWIFSLESLIN